MEGKSSFLSMGNIFPSFDLQVPFLHVFTISCLLMLLSEGVRKRDSIASLSEGMHVFEKESKYV